MATSERVHAGVQAVVRHALSQGWLTGGQLREALLLQEQLRTSGQPMELDPRSDDAAAVRLVIDQLRAGAR